MKDSYYSLISILIENKPEEEFVLRCKLNENNLSGIKKMELFVSNVRDNFEAIYEPNSDKDLTDSLDAFRIGNEFDDKRNVKYIFFLENEDDDFKFTWNLVKFENDEEIYRKPVDSVLLNKVDDREAQFSLLKELTMIIKEKDETIDRLTKANSNLKDIPGSSSASSARERINLWTRHVNNRRKYGPFRSLGPEGLDNSNVSQKNLKQKFIRLLKKFRVPDSEVFESEEQYQQALEQIAASDNENDNDIEELFGEDDIGGWSDNGKEFDEISISSTPKPSLRPYFSTWTLEGQNAEAEANRIVKNRIEFGDASTSINTQQTPDTSDISLKQQASEELREKQGNDKKSSKLRRILGKKDSTTKNAHVRQKKEK